MWAVMGAGKKTAVVVSAVGLAVLLSTLAFVDPFNLFGAKKTALGTASMSAGKKVESAGKASLATPDAKPKKTLGALADRKTGAEAA